MEEHRKKMFLGLLDRAYRIPDDELQDSDKPVKDGDKIRGELDTMEKQVFTFMMRKIDALDEVTAKTKATRKNGQLDDQMREQLLTEYERLLDEQTLLNNYLLWRARQRLGIEEETALGIRQGWQVVEIPTQPMRGLTLIIVTGAPDDPDTSDPQDEDPTRWN
ncbi:MAG: hypothetical protein U9Q03_03405 [Patescibacteria group bacterium]|nr:hypothetical protein [Patescibacteria group bacterium]